MPPMSPNSGETVLRLIALGALYGTAIALAVAFSPANGFVHPERLAHITGMVSVHK